MASSNFTISANSGSGNGYVSVGPSGGSNTNHSDRVATLTVTNGSVTRTVTITQFGIPTITLNSGQSTNIPATGATLSYTIYSRYPFGFVNQPEWTSISDSNGNYYFDGSTYPATRTTGTTFYITVGANSRTDTGRQTSDYGFAFRFKAPADSTSWDSHTTPINLVQAAKEEEQTYLNVSLTSASFDWNTDGYHTATITVDASSNSWSFTNSANGYFDAVRSGNTLTVSTKSNNTDSTRRTGTITFTLGNLTATTTLTQYRQPRIGYNSGSDHNPVAMAGGTRYVTVTSDYNWWFLPLPINDYITITDYQQNVMKLTELNPHLPIQTNNTFNITWGRNETEAVRRDYFYLGWIGLDGVTYLNSRNTVEFSQLDVAEVVHRVSCPDALSVSSIGGINRVNVISEDDWWFINVPSWITVYDENGNILIVNDASGLIEGSDVEHTFYLHWSAFTGTGSRSYKPTIEYAGGTESAVVTYTQYDTIATPYLRINNNYEIPYYRNIVEIKVSCDYDWYWSSIPSYVRIVDENNMPAHYSASSPNTTGKGTGVRTFYWIFSENTGSRRSIRPTAVYGTYSGGSFTQAGTADDFTLYQMGPYEINPTSGTNAMPYATQESFTFSLADTPWTYTAPSWMTVTADTDSHFGTFRMAIDANAGINRIGEVSITSGSHTLVYTYSQGGSVQLGPDPNIFYLNSNDSNSHTSVIRMMSSWTASASGFSWIHITSQDGTATQGTLTFTVDNNNTGNDRTGFIVVTDGNDTYDITVEQYGEEQDIFDVSPTSVNVHYANETVTVSNVYPASQTITATINIDSGYTAVADQTWIHILDGSVKTTGGTYTLYYYVEVNNNTGPNNRTGTITITRMSDSTTKTISITQYRKPSVSMTIPASVYYYSAAGSRVNNSSVPWPTAASNYAFVVRSYDNGTQYDWVQMGGVYSANTTQTLQVSNISTNDTSFTRDAVFAVYAWSPATGTYSKKLSGDFFTIRQLYY